ncbi:transcriptional regulator [Pseudomonas sp. v388]|uniref:ogr/Delta-like zinc finger family protein n=1 Tax=Pseudomonas sp. v388 TaxID=2479849 RepID=UPI000F779C71|nr:ogr/Delta-like zinc finger family protein [Pseudomonas sp. v388]RRV08113.1 transcriptional regulator [Pseudomonas sp. v388]
MRVYCTACNSKGKISSSREQTKGFTKLYCLCLNPECGHTWVAHLTFSHSLNAPVRRLDTLEVDDRLLDQLRDMTPAQKQQLIAQLGQQPGI